MRKAEYGQDAPQLSGAVVGRTLDLNLFMEGRSHPRPEIEWNGARHTWDTAPFLFKLTTKPQQDH